jgi:hypothetical protein
MRGEGPEHSIPLGGGRIRMRSFLEEEGCGVGGRGKRERKRSERRKEGWA